MFAFLFYLLIFALCFPGKFSALYMIPKDYTGAPLVLWSHGGPHSAFTNGFSIVATFLASLGKQYYFKTIILENLLNI